MMSGGEVRDRAVRTFPRADYRDVTIEMLAESEAALRANGAILERDLRDKSDQSRSYRELLSVAIAMLAKVSYQRDRAIAALAKLRTRRTVTLTSDTRS